MTEANSPKRSLLYVVQHDDVGYNPEESLLRAVLKRAILDLESHNQIDRRCAFNWIEYSSPDTYITSFPYVCEQLDLDPDRVRRLLKELGLFTSLKEKPSQKIVTFRRYIKFETA